MAGWIDAVDEAASTTSTELTSTIENRVMMEAKGGKKEDITRIQH